MKYAIVMGSGAMVQTPDLLRHSKVDVKDTQTAR
jgi:hypothetical protein